MQTARSRYKIENGAATATSAAQYFADEASQPDLRWPGPQFRQPLSGVLSAWLLAAATLTAPVVYYDPQCEFGGAGVYSITESGAQRRRRLSLREARLLALGTLADIERRLWQERAAEAQFLSSLWQADTDDLRDGRA
jgi:hypothetical protein